MSIYKSFKEIGIDKQNIADYFKEHVEFWGHKHSVKPPETLYEHINKVIEYFQKQIQQHKLESIIDKLITNISLSDIIIGNKIKELFFLSILFHDFGKINPNFQKLRMDNELFKEDKQIKIDYQHSFLSAYMFLNYAIENISIEINGNKQQILLYNFVFFFCIPIIKHHASYIEKNYDFNNEKNDTVYQFVKILNLKITKEQIQSLINFEKLDSGENLKSNFNALINDSNFDYFSLFALLKLNYSLLTASDYLATSDYMNNLKFETETDFGLLTNDLKQKLINNFDTNEDKPYNIDIINNTEKYLNYNIEDLQEKSNDNLNIIRKKMAAEVLTNIEINKEKKIFYIEAPTGGGKTNMSMIALRKLIEIHSEINKVFYVFPFTTLITQTAKSIKETFNLSETDIAQIHSKAGFQIKEYSDGKYGSELRNQIDNIFINYPISLLTHIKFFDILKSNKKDTNYLLHRLANSVVIIDELQAYSPSEWDKIKYYISKYSELFNIRFIIMSATLPRLDKISISGEKFEEYTELIPNAREKYLTNPNFADRVKINTELLEKKDIDLPELAKTLLNKSKEYSINRTDKFKNSVYTIIEFIFKKSASEFYEEINKINNDFFDEIFVLSGTIIEPRRKYIIDYLKDSVNRKKRILLITTQVVEAGVDIDMDLGFKNQSLIDSDEQLAGRINRNVNKQNCELYLFRKDNPIVIYGKDERFEITRKEFSNQEIQNILQNKEFNKLYNKVIENIKRNNDSVYKTNFSDYKGLFEKLSFREINDNFRLIEQENATIFIPLDIEINGYGSDNFSKEELIFAENNDAFTDEGNNIISGEKIWNLYINLIENREMEFCRKQIDMKILNGIISKFVFSVFLKKADDLKEFLDFNEETGAYKFYQYLKLKKEHIGDDSLYSYEGGLSEKILKNETDKTFVFI